MSLSIDFLSVGLTLFMLIIFKLFLLIILVKLMMSGSNDHLDHQFLSGIGANLEIPSEGKLESLAIRCKTLSEDFPSVFNDEEPTFYDVGQGDCAVLTTKSEKKNIPKSSTSTGTKKKMISKGKKSFVPKKPNSDESDDPSGHNPGPSIERSFEEYRSKSDYQLYIESNDFQTDSLKTLVDTCFRLSESEGRQLFLVWKEHINLILKLIEKGHTPQLLYLKHVIPKGIDCLSVFFEGMTIGIHLGKISSSNKMFKDLSTYVEDLSIINQKTQGETKALQAQTLEFVNQMSNASQTIVNFQKAVEDVKLISIKHDLMPKPQFETRTTRPIPTLESFETTVTEEESEEIKVKEIKGNGTFKSSIGVIKLRNNVVTSWMPSHSVYTCFAGLTGKPLNVARFITNFDLEGLKIRAKMNPNWLKVSIPKEQEINKQVLINDVRGLEKKSHQWIQIRQAFEEDTS